MRHASRVPRARWRQPPCSRAASQRSSPSALSSVAPRQATPHDASSQDRGYREAGEFDAGASRWALRARRRAIALRPSRAAEDTQHRGRARDRSSRCCAAIPTTCSALNLAGYLLADGKQRLGDAERLPAPARELSPGDPRSRQLGLAALPRRATREAAARARRTPRGSRRSSPRSSYTSPPPPPTAPPRTAARPRRGAASVPRPRSAGSTPSRKVIR